MNIKEILRNHKLWLDTDGREGEKANFSGSNFSGSNLSGSNFSGVDFSESNFSKSNFSESNFSGSDFSESNLFCADFFGANLFCTSLFGANLYCAKNIIQFGPVGNTRRMGYAVDHGDKIMVKLGCFWGDEQTATRNITKKYGPDSSYLAIVNAACRELRERRRDIDK